MSRNSHYNYMPSDFFSHQALELTFRLLRNNHPLLANALTHTIDQVKTVSYTELHSAYTGEMLLNIDVVASLKAHTIGKIVSALTDIVETALKRNDLPNEHMSILRNLIEDWVQLTEWILEHNHADDMNDRSAYH